MNFNLTKEILNYGKSIKKYKLEIIDEFDDETLFDCYNELYHTALTTFGNNYVSFLVETKDLYVYSNSFPIHNFTKMFKLNHPEVTIKITETM